MTSVFSAEGKNVPCTVIEAGPCVVTQVKTVEKTAIKLFSWFSGQEGKSTLQSWMGTFKKLE